MNKKRHQKYLIKYGNKNDTKREKNICRKSRKWINKAGSERKQIGVNRR